MSDLKLFRIDKGVATELASNTFPLERKLQKLIEENMDVLFGTRFVKSEHSTGAIHSGRIDSLGLDENGTPVIFEYKRAVKENVINQGLFYLDWLLDHRGDFSELVRSTLGPREAESIDWSAPRLVCVASDFDRYDEHAIAQIGRNIELVRYRDFDGELLALDRVASVFGASDVGELPSPQRRPKRSASPDKTVTEKLAAASDELRDLFVTLDTQLMAQGDDITQEAKKFYFAYRRLKNFACVEVQPQSKSLLVYLKVNPDLVALEDGFSRDVRSIGHYGTGDLELRISRLDDVTKALPHIQSSYEAS